MAALNYPHTNYHVVQPGNTLFSISNLYDISMDDLADANPDIDPGSMQTGHKLKLPLSNKLSLCPKGADTYIVQENDTFYSICKSFKLRFSALLKANPNLNPDALLIGQSICIPIISSSYSNKTYRIKLLYPYRWSRVDDISCEGIDGFFRIAAVSDAASLEDSAANEAFHKLKPYGSSPVIEKCQIAGNAACYVIPSRDQPMEMRGQSALIVEYPEQVHIENCSYKYLIIQVDFKHLKDISESLEFMSK